MGQIGISSRRGATGDVCASAERRNAREKPSWPTGGRTPEVGGGSRALPDVHTSRRGALLTTDLGNAVKPLPFRDDRL